MEKFPCHFEKKKKKLKKPPTEPGDRQLHFIYLKAHRGPLGVGVCQRLRALPRRSSTDGPAGDVRGYVKVTVSPCHSWVCPHADHCLFIHLIFFFFSVQLVLQLPQHQIKANSPKKPWAINSDVADAALRDGGVSEELTELVSLLGDMSWVHLTCGVKPRSRFLTSALCRTCKRLNHRYNFIITLLISQLYSIGFSHARFRCM